MSIRDQQVSDAEENVLLSEMKAGRNPELSYVLQRIAELFKDNPAGLPRFSLALLENDAISNPGVINAMLGGMKTDINTAYAEVMDLQNQMMAMANYYETEKNKIGKALSQTTHRIEDVVERLKHRTEIAFTRQFHNFLEVEFEGNAGQNLPVTDVLIDLTRGAATLDKLKQGTARYDLSGAKAEVTVSGNAITTTSTGNIDNLLKDTINTIWHYEVSTATPDPVTVIINLELENPLLTTTVAFVSESPAVTDITLYTSRDGVTYLKQGTKKSQGMTVWNILSDTISFVRFELVKNEPDVTRGADNRSFFGGSRIMIQREVYQQEGRYVSAPIHLGTSLTESGKWITIVESVTVTPVDTVLPGTSIRYYVALGEDVNDKQFLEWTEVDKNGVIEFDVLEPIVIPILANVLGTNYGVPEAGGLLDRFTLARYTNINPSLRAIPGVTKLYMGHKMYRIDTVPGFRQTSTPAGETGPADWTNIDSSLIITRYARVSRTIENASISLHAGELNRMSIEFFVSTDTPPLVKQISVDSNSLMSVYLNGTLVPSTSVDNVTLQFTFKFAVGLNRLEFYTYTSSAVDHVPWAPKIDFAFADWYRASATSLTEVSINDLWNNVSVRDRTKFAIDYIANWRILLNYAPKLLDVEGIGVDYLLDTKGFTTSAATTETIRVMAVFSRTASVGETSAQLSQYQVVVKHVTVID